MKRKFLTFILILCVLAATFNSSLICFADSLTPEKELNAVVANMKSSFELDPDGILSVEYYGYINDGESILSDTEAVKNIPAELVEEFNLYKFYYYRAKALNTLTTTFVSATYTVKFENKSFYFYDEQWGEVESVYNEYTDKITASTVESDLDKILSDYYNSIDALVDREELDAMVSENVSDAVKSMDITIVKKVNDALADKGIPPVDEEKIPLYLIGSNTEAYDKWFAEILSFGFSTQNALKVDRIHTKAIETLITLPKNTEKSAYLEIAKSAISELEKIEIETNVENEYLLESRKEAALLQIQYFLASEAYTEAENEVRKEMKKITDNAISEIQASITVAEVEQSLNKALDSLSDIEVGGKDWIKIMTVGIVLVVVLIAVVAVFIIKKKRSIKKPNSIEEEDEEITVEEAENSEAINENHEGE